MRPLARSMVFCLLLSAGCRKADAPPALLPPLGLAAGCQPLLAGANCLLPYPSDYFRVADAGSATGFQIVTSGAAKLRLPADGGLGPVSADLADWRPIDGFSTVPPIVALLPEPVADQGFVHVLDDPSASETPGSQTLLLTGGGQFVPHFVDLDPRATDPSRQAIVLHPLVALAHETRYVVALQGIRGADGGLLPAPEGFRRLRDSQSAGDPALNPLQSHFDQEIFPVLAQAGVARANVQLAWDFTTGSEAQADGDMLRVRELTLAWLASQTPAVAVDSVDAGTSPEGWEVVHGTVQGPLFLEADQPGAALARGADGQVAQHGLESFTFTAEVPASVRDEFGPGRTVSYGHGFFGAQSEVTDGAATHIANRLHSVFFAIDWEGMALADGFVVAGNLDSAPSQAMTFTDRVPQAMANWMVLSAALAGPLFHLPALARSTVAGAPGVSTNGAGVSNAGAPLFDGDPVNYLGISQGAILGGVLAALHPTHRQICLQVGGAAFTTMMWRAQPFAQFLFFLSQSMPDPLEQQAFAATMQPYFDRIDPATFAPYVLQNPLPGSPPRRVLMQNGLGDQEVPNVGSFIEARLLGPLPEIAPNTFPVFGLTQTPAPLSSALQLFDFGVDLPAVYDRADPGSGVDPTLVHDNVRRLSTGLDQLDAFFTPDGGILNPCDGGSCLNACDGGSCWPL